MKPTTVITAAPVPVWEFHVGKAIVRVYGHGTDGKASFDYYGSGKTFAIRFRLEGSKAAKDRAAEKIHQLGSVITSREHFVDVIGDDSMLDTFAAMRGIRVKP